MAYYPASSLSKHEVFLFPGEHGGQLEDIAERYGVDPERITDFSVNVNFLGPPPSLGTVLQRAFPLLARYPDSESRHLRRKLAHVMSLSAEQILVGNGCSELIFLISRCFQPERVLIVQPTFSEYQRSVSLVGGQVEHHLLSPQTHFRLDLDALIQNASGAEILFLCNPNNPTGRLLAKAQVLTLADSLPQTLIVVDEAFMDFVDDATSCSVMTEVFDYPNLIVLRSLTKLFAIPGLRLGYLVAHPTRIAHLARIKEPWSVNCLAQLAGMYLLDQTDYIRQTRRLVRAERQFLFEALSRLDWLFPYSTEANFFLVRIRRPRLTAARLNAKLLQRGLLVRDCSNFVGLNEQFFRIAVRGRAENQRLLTALRKVGENDS